MRQITLFVFGVLLAAVIGAEGFAEETKTPWWQFGGGKDTPSVPTSVAPAPTMTPAMPVEPPAADEPWFPRPSMPKLSWFNSGSPDETVTPTAIESMPTDSPVTAGTQPRQTSTHFGKPTQRSRPRNTWAQQPASATTDASNPSTWHKMSQGTHNAWHKTVDFVTPGDGPDAPVVRSEPRESWWQRMWGPEEEKNEGPQTVTEWMAQDRIDP